MITLEEEKYIEANKSKNLSTFREIMSETPSKKLKGFGS
jgi:hypothetical protein